MEPGMDRSMSESKRPLTSIALGVLVLIGGLVSISAGSTYLGSDDVSGITAWLLIIAGILMAIGGIGCFIGRRPVLWRILFASLCVEAVGGIAMAVDETVVGGIVLIVICAVFIWVVHWTDIRRWFGA